MSSPRALNDVSGWLYRSLWMGVVVMAGLVSDGGFHSRTMTTPVAWNRMVLLWEEDEELESQMEKKSQK
jgi:hypothetical protein